MGVIKTEKLSGRQRNRPLKDYSGERFGRLVAVSLVERDAKWNGHKWLFRCDCGKDHVANIKLVRCGKVASCGCLFSEVVAARNKTHGLSRLHPREYRVWKDMRARCQNANNTSFNNYGGRGISVCKSWQSFATFFSDMGPRPDGASIDRIDVNGNYCPENCRWANDKEQANNKRSNNVITFRGEEKTLAAWCEEIGIEPSKVRYRLRQGWPIERAFSLCDQRKVKN